MKRYYVGDEGLVEDAAGSWISYEDHLNALAQRPEVGALEAIREQIPAGCQDDRASHASDCRTCRIWAILRPLSGPSVP